MVEGGDTAEEHVPDGANRGVGQHLSLSFLGRGAVEFVDGTVDISLRRAGPSPGELGALPGRGPRDGHWQLVQRRGELGPIAEKVADLPGYLDARLLLPSPEGLGAGAPVLRGGHQVPPRAEMTIDHAVRGQEPLRLLG